MIKINVNSSVNYDILIESGLLDRCGELVATVVRSKKCALVTDDIVDKLYSEKVLKSLKKSGFETVKFVVPSGETSKSHEQLISIYNFLSENDITRTDFLIALGGGVVGDLTGYCGKNFVGCFKQPVLVIADTDTLNTLSDDIFADGMGEVVKYGMIRSKSLFDKLSKGNVRGDTKLMNEIIAECISIKRDVVENDEFDTGERMILNFGHTFGHAIEKYVGYGNIHHGKAVAIGMYMITKAAEKNGSAENGSAGKLKACLEPNSLPHISDIKADKLYVLSIGDKKRTSDKIRIIICPEVGKSKIVTMGLKEYKEFLELI